MASSPPLARRWSVVKSETRRIVYLVDTFDFGHPGWTRDLAFARQKADEIAGAVVDADWLDGNFAAWLSTGRVPADAQP